MDSSHLEKMGRELRCPICLSLLNSAVSLNCNHVFCNLCIEKSMKSASSCPVCKVPYRRREIRPAPHMDNLVSIYKSMEVYSSVNIFGPQTVAASELSGGKNQPGADMIRESGKTCSGTPDLQNQRKLNGKRSKRSSKSNNIISSPVPVRPSLPMKKRVQVPKHPLPETPTQPTKHEVNLGDHTKNEPQSSVAQNEVTMLNKNGELEFCPFFWLREEEDADKSSQPTDEDPVMDTPPAVPCFSDIKDSDELQCSMTPENGLSIASHNADLFDSEMFEWTQRACSPELCSTPVKKENEETVRCEGIPGKEDKTKSVGDEPDNRENIIAQKEADKMVVNLVTSVCPGSQYFANNGRVTRPNKRTKKASESYKSNRAKRTKGIYINSNNIAEDNIQGEKFDIVSNHGNSLNLRRKPNKRVKKVCQDPILRETMPKSVSTLDEGAELLKSSESSKNKQAKTTKLIASEVLVEDYKQEEKCDTIGNPGSASSLKLNPKKRVRKVCLDPCGTETMPENFSILAEGTKPPNQGDRSMLVVDLSGSFDDKECNGKNNNTTAQRQRDCARRSKSRKLNSVHDIQSHSNRPKSFTRGSDYRVFDLAAESRENEIGSLMDLEGDKKLERSKEVKLLTVDISKVTSVKDGSIHNSAKETQLFGKLQRSSDSSEKEKTCPILNGILRKCKINTNKIQCSFCQSTEDGEASGVMVHYLHGKPVIVDYNGEANIIHVHRNCAEWAPNVYFEDDNAINLEAELARSQRIKCGSCGLKGAALGCYEKSCRRSFHVPCAKLIAQCRWDNDNFVMLCPSHASSKLPNEISESQPKPKKKCLPRQLPINQPQVVKQHSGTSSCWNFRGLLGKLVLCCSALTVAEKVTVSEFEKLFGVTVLTNWDSRVTHLIASTDENGACRRTLKFLMGILEGKWILSIEWVKACLKAMENVDEQLYEIDVDIHGLRGGPQLGRLRVINKQPKPLEGYKFYFAGDFQPSYKGYLHDLVIAAGGTVLHRKPISGNNKAQSSTFIIYSLELPDKCKPNKRKLIISRRRSDAEALASSCHASVATNSWILNSIAACKLQNLAE